MPRRLSRRYRAGVGLALCAAALLTACSSPATGADRYADGANKVTALVSEALTAAATGQATEPPVSAPVTCRKKVLGYAVGSAGTHRAESPAVVTLPADVKTGVLLDRVVAGWKANDYTVDTSKRGEDRYPQVSAAVPGGYHVVATVLTQQHQLTVYAVSPCLHGA